MSATADTKLLDHFSYSVHRGGVLHQREMEIKLESNLNQIRSPHAIINIGGETKGNLDNFDNYCALLWIDSSMARSGGQDSSGRFAGSGAFSMSELVVVIPNGEWVPVLETKCFKAEKIDSVTLKKITTTAKVQETFVYGNVFVVGVQTGLFCSLVQMVFLEYVHKSAGLSIEDASEAGSNEFKVSLEKNTDSPTIDADTSA